MTLAKTEQLCQSIVMRLILFCLLMAGPVEGFATQAVYSIVQGATSRDTAHFTLVAHRSDPLNFRIGPVNGTLNVAPERVLVATLEGSEWAVHRFMFTGLSAGEVYRLAIFNPSGALVDEREFTSLDGDKTNARIALASCLMRQLHNPFVWSQLSKPSNRPDLMLILGDAVYLDHANLLIPKTPNSELEVWEEFVKSRRRLGLYFWHRLVPVLSVWDDHDSGGNGIDARFALMPKIRAIYDVFFANEPIPGFLERGPGLSLSFRAFQKRFIMLDGRSFRELESVYPLFGSAQEKWMSERLESGGNMLLSGSQFFGRYIAKDSFDHNWPEEAAQFYQRLKASGAEAGATLLFGSGDIHFSELQRIAAEKFGYATYEITSSSAHSSAFPGHYLLKGHNPQRFQVTGTHNVILLEMTPPIGPAVADTAAWRLHVRALGWRGGDLFSSDLRVCERSLL